MFITNPGTKNINYLCLRIFHEIFQKNILRFIKYLENILPLMFRKLGIIVFIGFCGALSAKDNVYFPSFFNSYFFNKYQLTPSYLPIDVKLELSGNYKSLLGELKKISAYSFSAARVLGSDKSQQHALRVSLYNEREGSYISSPRGYVGYAFRQKLNEDAAIFSGINLGFAGIYYSAPTVTQSSTMLPDGAVALGGSWKGLLVDLSMHQAFNSARNILGSPLVLERYYHMHVSYKKDLGLNWQSKSHTLYRLFPSISNEWLVSTSLTYKELFSLGLSYKYQSSLSFFTALDLKNERDHVQLFFNYNSVAFKLAPAWQSGVELGLNYWMQ